MTYFLWDKFDFPLFRGVALKPSYSKGNHVHTLIENGCEWCSKNVAGLMCGLASRSKNAASRSYFMCPCYTFL